MLLCVLTLQSEMVLTPVLSPLPAIPLPTHKMMAAARKQHEAEVAQISQDMEEDMDFLKGGGGSRWARVQGGHVRGEEGATAASTCPT